MFGIGSWEFLLIAVLALLLFGPDKLPEFARTIGRLIRDFKRYQDLMESTIRAEIYSTESADKPDPFKKGKEFRKRVESGEFEGEDGQPADEAEADDGEPESGEDIPAGDAETDEVPASADAEDAADAEPRPTGLPDDHPLHDALVAGEDIGIDDDVDLDAIDQADLGWVPGHDSSGEGGDGDKA
ncbi:MAG: twin-arginine translocase TatA/TatE family subunit [Coriobacteriia bacterium]|nr:twin-arginine translocase TatA/TatE family subunit [Coriobacteriia bacterium]